MSDDPLVMALKPVEEKAERRAMPVPRFFEFRRDELPNGDTIRPGDPVFVRVMAVVKAVNDEGGIMVNVMNVNGLPPQTENDAPRAEIRVRNDQAVSP